MYLKLKVLYKGLVSGKCQAVLLHVFAGKGSGAFCLPKNAGENEVGSRIWKYLKEICWLLKAVAPPR